MANRSDLGLSQNKFLIMYDDHYASKRLTDNQTLVAQPLSDVEAAYSQGGREGTMGN